MGTNRTILALGVLALVPLTDFAQTLSPLQDAHYVPGNGTNYGTATTVTVGSSSSVGLIQFDLSTLPAGVTASQVQKGTLTLYLDHVAAGGTINIDTVSASTPWGELTVNGTSPPYSGSAVATAVPAAVANTFLTVDATAAVQGWITSPGSNNGFMILGNGSTSVQFDSKENLNTSHPATLTIVLANTGPAGPPGAAGANGNTIWSGATAPAASIGAVGDFYLLTTTQCLYGPKTSGPWPGTCTSLIGLPGAAGTGSSTSVTDLGSISWVNANTATFAAGGAAFATATISTTAGQSMTLSPMNLVKWGQYNLEITNASGAAAALTLGTGGSCSAWQVAGGGGGAIALSGASAIDWLNFTFDGTNCVAWFSNNHN